MGTRDVMMGDNGGFMVPEDVALFASCVGDLARDRALHQAKSDEAIRYAKRWSASALATQLREVYVSLVRGEPRAEQVRKVA
jgi:hypothetical protein